MSYIKGSLDKEKPKGKKEKTFKFSSSKKVSDEQWEEVYEELRRLLKKYGITLTRVSKARKKK